MKKLFLLFMAFAFTSGMYAQTGTMKKQMPKKDHVMMKDGKMCTMMSGKKMDMEKDMTMSNGTMVSTTGKVTMKDGKTMMMKNGDMMDMDGMMGKHKMMHKHHMMRKHTMMKKEDSEMKK